MTRSQRYWTLSFLALGAIATALALWPRDDGLDTLQRIQERGFVRVGTVNSPITYYLGPDYEAHGFEYELAQQFANELGVEVQMVVAATYTELFELLRRRRVDLLAAGVTATDEFSK